jgi:hypothetical protein
MKKYLLLLLSMGMAALLSTCSGDTLESDGRENSPIKSKLTVMVYDAISGKPIDAEVFLLSAKKSEVATKGTVTFEDVRVGEHSLRVEMTGYASKLAYTYIDLVPAATNGVESKNNIVAVSNEKVEKILLYPQGTTLVGYVCYENKYSDCNPANDVIVSVEILDDWFVKKYFESKPTEDGKYKIEGLPTTNTANYKIEAVPTKDLGGINFASIEIETGLPTLNAGEISNTTVLKFTQNRDNEAFFEVASYPHTFKKTDQKITFTFSESIDKNRIYAEPQTFKIKQGGVTPAVSHVWANNTLEITRLESEWKDDDIIIEFYDLKSVSGKTLGGEYTISLELVDLAKGDAVKGVRAIPIRPIDYNETEINLRWELIEGATSYDIYRKDSAAANYVLATSVVIPKEIAIGFKYNLSLGFEILSDREVSFIVQAVNKKSKSPLETENTETKIVKAVVKDVVAPKLLDPVETSNGNIRWTKGRKDFDITFSEPINKETLEGIPQGFELLDSDDEILHFYVEAGVNSNFTLTGLKDKAGNYYNQGGRLNVEVLP